jgi:hypothetical protein
MHKKLIWDTDLVSHFSDEGQHFMVVTQPHHHLHQENLVMKNVSKEERQRVWLEAETDVFQ